MRLGSKGAVTSPALFNLFINDITDDFPPGVSASLYADDLAIWCSDRDVSAAETKVQRALDSLEEWARRWKMVVSLEKTTSTIFTLDPAEARREAALHFQGQPVKFSPTTTFLGIALDRSLTFTGHVKTIKAKMLQRNNVLRAISGTTWGCSPSDLRSTYLAFSRACADYAAGAWMPGLSESGLRELETVQRQACRTITGCVRSTPVDALAREADLLPFSARRRQLAAVAMERHSRDLPGDPVQRILLPENRPRQRLRYDRGWARTGQEISKDAGLDDFPREPFLVVASTPPWESPPPPTVFFHTGLVRPLPQNAPAEQRRTAAEETLAGLPNPDVQAFTDGSATAGTERGGAGAVVYRSGREVKRIRAPAGRFTSSYTAELIALRETLKYIESILTDQDPALNIQLCTDSLSSLMRLREGPANQTERVADQVWLSLRRLGRRHRVDLQWVPGHAGVAGNEIADAVAREAAELLQDGTPITFAAAKSLLKRHPIGDRRPAPANLPALCPEMRARMAAEGIEQVFLVHVTVLPELLAAAESPLPPADLCISAPAGRGTTLAFVLPLVPAVFRQYDADTPLCVRLLGGDTVARGGANWWRWGRAARSPWLIVVSTPGWLMDHITSAEGFSLAHLRYLVIDEADRVIEMAETGWLKAVERVAAATARRPASPAG
ncbi:ATP-dependent RNA helicase DDX51 [Amphibalanus amphitrite]|uniref:ATP-dependent RNA helicase DDX51 n=1 Tax=Amphibalanus amphitrite TaxID=1232801 RepID=A0A6A4WNV8_AMPAM|nr:ATP-dependent RNA helicase DDX51 [Amphibalanus amphitrite]